jgi:hypothetical protein
MVPDEQLKQDLDAEISRLLREYESEGLDAETIAESFDRYSTLAETRA